MAVWVMKPTNVVSPTSLSWPMLWSRRSSRRFFAQEHSQYTLEFDVVFGGEDLGMPSGSM